MFSFTGGSKSEAIGATVQPLQKIETKGEEEEEAEWEAIGMYIFYY